MLLVKTKDFRKVDFVFQNQESQFVKVIEKLSEILELNASSLDYLFAFHSRKTKLFCTFNEWRSYDPLEEFKRLNLLDGFW